MSGEEREITLGLLNAVCNNPNVTQRSIAKDLGVALGLANSYLKRCVKKGFIKIQQAPANRYKYYLTPRGFAEKSALATEFLTQGFQFFRHTRNQCSDIFHECAERGWHRVALHGLTDAAEIAVLCTANINVEIIGIVDESSSLGHYNGIKVVQAFTELDDIDAIIITDLGNPQASYDKLIMMLSKERVLAPDILNVDRRNEPLEKAI